MKKLVKAVEEFCSYLFVPQWEKRSKDYGLDGWLDEILAK